MALLWCEGFDTYGTSTVLALQGAWAQFAAGTGGAVAISATNPRTGGQHFRFTTAGAASSGNYIARRVLTKTTVECGVGFAFSIASLPGTANRMCLLSWRDNANLTVASLYVTTTGQIQFYRGDGVTGGTGTLLGTSGQVLISGAYQHIEAHFKADAATGFCEVRANGVTVLNVAGQNTIQAGTAGTVGQIAFAMNPPPGAGNYSVPASWDIDDLYVWDATGANNNTFIGDKGVFTLFPNADGIGNNWQLSSGSTGFSLINTNPPNDANFIFASAAPAHDSFGMQDVPAQVVSIVALYLTTRATKTDAGTGIIQAGLISGTSVAAGAAKSVTNAISYYGDVFETDPATGAPWTPTGVNTVLATIDRTT